MKNQEEIGTFIVTRYHMRQHLSDSHCKFPHWHFLLLRTEILIERIILLQSFQGESRFL